MRELRERQAKEREYAEIQDVISRTFSSDEEHTYAGIGSLDSSVDSNGTDPYNHHYHLPQSPQSPPPPLSLQDNGPPLEALYAQVNKPRNGRPAAPDRYGSTKKQSICRRCEVTDTKKAFSPVLVLRNSLVHLHIIYNVEPV